MLLSKPFTSTRLRECVAELLGRTPVPDRRSEGSPRSVDNGRIRLKRPESARANDSTLGTDAYRTHVGMSETKLALCIAGAALGGMGLIAGIVALVARAR